MNHHATAVILGDRGVLIRGESGAGKSLLGLRLMERCRTAGLFASLVADDQVLLEARGGRLVCRAPIAIAGLAEIRGIGPHGLDFEPMAVVDLVVDLVDRAQAPRFPEDGTITLIGCELGHLTLAARAFAGATLAVLAKLPLPPFR